MTLATQCVTWALLVFVTAGLGEATTNTGELDEVIKHVPDFAKALYSQLAKARYSRNIFFSPLSIHFALSLAYLGAKGKTAQQMAAGLHLPASVEVVKKGFEQLAQGIAAANGEFEVDIANKIYLNASSNIKPEFIAIATKNFHTDVEDVDFSSAEKATHIINEWVGKKTHGKINNIISRDSITPDTVYLLVNAVYFKSMWQYAFNKGATSSKRFHVTAQQSKNVDMMRNEGYFVLVHNHEIGADILELPYRNQTLGLVVILPFKIDGLSEVEKILETANLKTILKPFEFSETRQAGHVSPQKVDVQLPRFKVEESVALKDHLMALGMTEMFGGFADFTGISSNKTHMSEVVHKAFIQVDEEGTVAAAATGVGGHLIHPGLPPPPPIPFLADHPFIFLLRCRISGVVVFMGRLVDPR